MMHTSGKLFPLWSTIIQRVTKLLLATILLRAGYAKMRSKSSTAESMNNLGLHRFSSVAPFVPMAELALGIVLLTGRSR